MLGHSLVVVADAHLGASPAAVEEALVRFVDAVPTLGDCLLVNGDLFEFWFAYSHVIPRRGFRVTAALARLRQRVPIVMVGGNHDRWGHDFWSADIGVQFAPRQTTFEIGRRRVLAVHGDGLTELTRRARLVHRLINHPLTARVYRALHPDFGFGVVDRLGPHLGDQTRDEAIFEAAARRQREWAKRTLQNDPSLGLVVMAHTHRADLLDLPDGRQYLNPGAWLDGLRYAVATESGAELRTFA